MSDDPHGWGAFWTLYEEGVWEPATRELIDTLEPGDLYVDVGAWIGPTVLWALARGAEVIAVEPDPIALPNLRRLVPDIELWEGAVSAEGGPVQLATNPRGGGWLGDSMSRLGPEGVVVESWTLPEILHGRRPALVKIDVEGYESELCPSLMPYLADLGATVQVSFHGGLLEREWFAGFGSVDWPTDPHGDLVARP